MADKVLTARDYAKREGAEDVKSRIRRTAIKWGLRYVEDKTAGNPVYARIDFGRWIADCECGGAEAVDPDEPLFFCVSCGNARTSGRARHVVFPDQRKEIEDAVMARPLAKRGGGDAISQQITAKPKGEPRSWRPGEEVKHGV